MQSSISDYSPFSHPLLFYVGNNNMNNKHDSNVLCHDNYSYFSYNNVYCTNYCDICFDLINDNIDRYEKCLENKIKQENDYQYHKNLYYYQNNYMSNNYMSNYYDTNMYW